MCWDQIQNSGVWHFSSSGCEGVRHAVPAVQVLQLLRHQHQVRCQQDQPDLRAGQVGLYKYKLKNPQMFTHHLSYDPQVANPKWGDRLHWGGDDALRSSSTSGFVLHKSSEASFRNHQLYEYYFILKLKLVDAPKCESFFACQKTFTLFNWSLSNHIFEFPH